MKRISCFTAVITSILLAILLSCRSNIESEKNTVNISIETDENLSISSDNIDVKIGSKWKNIKKRVLACVHCKKGYKIGKVMRKDDDETHLIEHSYSFEENASIYITSKRGNIKENDNNAEDSVDPDDKICIEIKGDNHIEIENDELVIDKGSIWKNIKAEIIERLEIDKGYRLNKFKLISSKGKTLYDEYVFKKDACVYAISKKEKKQQLQPQPKESVKIYLKGDENVIFQYNFLKVPKCTQWKDIKDIEYIHAVSAKAGFHLSGWHLAEDANSPLLEDEHQFCEETTIFIFAISDEVSSDNKHTEVKVGDDELMIDVVPCTEGIKCSSINYLLPNNKPKSRSDKLWQGIFSDDVTVYIAPFKMAKYELTYRIWEETRKWAIKRGYVFLNAGWKGSQNNDALTEMHPVTQISWCDAIIWCNAHTERLKGCTDDCVYLDSNNLVLKDANKVLLDGTTGIDSNFVLNLTIEKSKKGFRLPTEEEWEYVARKEEKKSDNTDNAGEKLFFTKLNSVSGAKCEIAFDRKHSRNFSFMKKELEATTVCQKYFSGVDNEYFLPYVFSTRTVGTKRANSLGFHDMSGNISEFSSALTEESIFKKTKSEGVFCVIRGGAWDDHSYYCTVGIRNCRNIKEGAENIGFRLCCNQ